MFNFFNKSKEKISKNKKEELSNATILDREDGNDFKPPIDEQWNTFLFPDTFTISAHEANETKNILVKIQNLFPQQYADLKQQAEEGLSDSEIAEALKDLASQIPE